LEEPLSEVTEIPAGGSVQVLRTLRVRRSDVKITEGCGVGDENQRWMDSLRASEFSA
jgi:hypothetical protein